MHRPFVARFVICLAAILVLSACTRSAVQPDGKPTSSNATVTTAGSDAPSTGTSRGTIPIPALPVAQGNAPAMGATPSAPAPLTTAAATLGDLFFASATTGWVDVYGCSDLGTDQGCTGAVAATTDGGAHWRQVSLGAVLPGQLLFAPGGQHGWLLATPADCARWDPQFYRAPGCLATDLYATADSGQTWSKAFSLTGSRIIKLLLTADSSRLLAITTATRGTAARPDWNAADTLLISADGGHTWRTLPTPGFTPVDADFRTAQTGWALGYACADGGGAVSSCPMGLYATTDGGAHWQKELETQPITAVTSGSYSVDFVSDTAGWVLLPRTADCGRNGCWSNLWQTTDGGRHFRQIQPALDYGLWAITPSSDTGHGWSQDLHFVSPTVGWIPASSSYFGVGGVAVTRDGGGTWQNVGGNWNVGSFQALDAANAWLVAAQAAGGGASRGGRFLTHTSDGGQTWQQALVVPAPNGPVRFLDGSTGYAAGAVGDTGAVLRTTDGGHTWAQVASFPNTDLTVVSFLDERTGWVGGNLDPNGVGVTGDQRDHGLYRVWQTTDGGATWRQISTGTGFIDGLALFGPGHGLQAVGSGENGVQVTFSQTSDDGQTWQQVGTYTGVVQIGEVDFADDRHGLMLALPTGPFGTLPVGSDSAVMLTADGGKSWTALGSLDFNKYGGYAATVRYPTPDRAYVVEGQSLLTSTDGCQTWSSIWLPVRLTWAARPPRPAAVDFADGRHGWFITSSGQLYATADGAASWRQP